MISAAAENRSFWPGLFLMLLAPLVAEVIPGATRVSALFVYPIEVLVWGGGALMIRALCKNLKLGWVNMLLLAVALSVAEEFVIQQTSTAPVVIQLKGVEYARAFNINYVYFLWAVMYEAVLVVFLPIQLTDLIFSRRAERGFLGKYAAIVVGVLFCAGAFLAWFSWTQHARTEVFHLPKYDAPAHILIGGALAIAALVFLAIGPTRRALAQTPAPKAPPAPWVLGLLSAIWPIAWFAIEMLAFGQWPEVPPAAAVAGGLVTIAIIMALLPGWHAHERWSKAHAFAMSFGVMASTMAIFFIAFQGAAPLDLYGKIAIDVIALALLIWLGFIVARRSNAPAR